MTQKVTDKLLRSFIAGLLVLTSFSVLAAPSAENGLILKDTVHKVERFVDENGEVQRRLVDVDSVIPGDELRYTITFSNEGTAIVDAGSIVITNKIPEAAEYIDGTAFGSGTDITFSVNGGGEYAAADDLTVQVAGAEVAASPKDYTTIRWIFQPELAANSEGFVSFNVRLK